MTSDGDADDGTSVLSKATKYSLLLFVLNVVVWGSIVLLWLVRLLFFAQAQVVDRCGTRAACLSLSLRAHYTPPRA